MMTPLLNSLRTWAQIVALVVLVVWAMGLTTWPWWEAILFAAAIILLGKVPDLLLSWLGSRKTGPRNGGDVIFTPGNGRDGGRPGRIVLEYRATVQAPALILRNSFTGSGLEIYVGEEDPQVAFADHEAPSPEQALYVRTRDPAIYRRGVEGWERM